MKRKLVAAILGIAASVSLVSSAHAQGSVTFENYGFTTDSTTTYGAAGLGGTVGTGVNTAYTAGLWYFLGTTTLAAGNGNDLLPAGWELAPITQQFNVGAEAGPAGVGRFIGGNAIIADYTTGPITFAVTAYNGATYATTTGAGAGRGHSSGFTLPSIAASGSPVGEFGPGLTSFAVLPVPEPSIFALSGLGAAALMMIRRKK